MMQALLVVDEPTMKAALENALVRRGWNVVAARSREEAANAWSSKSFELIVVRDASRAEGAEVVRALRREQASDVRVLGITPADPAAIRRLLDAGVDDLDLEPLSETSLESRLALAEREASRNIAEKKRREAASRQSEARYRALFDQSPVGVFLCDRNLLITHCNDRLIQIIGVPYEQLVGAKLLSVRDNRLVPGLRAAVAGKPAFYEGPYRTRTGKQLHVSVRYAPLRDGEGEVVGGIGVLEDISERVLADGRLRAQAAEMERVNAALRERTLELEAAIHARSRLYSAMNHELRTPISAVLLYQELLLAGSLGPLEPEQSRALEHSHTATTHLLELVRDILDLSKIEAGKVTVQPVTVSVRELLEDLHAAMTPLVERHGSVLRLDMASDPGELFTDPQRVRQILMNFVSNAAKFGERGPIHIRSWEADAGSLCIDVADRGIGIAPEELADIFDEFVQLDTGNIEGTGLGLAISRRLAELLGGRLEVESAVGIGSTFRLILPRGMLAEVEATIGVT